MEMWDLYDAEGNRTGEKHERGQPIPEGAYHLVIHFWVRNSKGQLLAQKRSQSVKSWPGLWSTTGGSVQAGENAETGLHREVGEELGLNLHNFPGTKKIYSFVGKTALVEVFLLESDDVLIENLSYDSEVETTQYYTREEMDQLIEEEKMVPFRSVYLDILFGKIPPTQNSFARHSPLR